MEFGCLTGYIPLTKLSGVFVRFRAPLHYCGLGKQKGALHGELLKVRSTVNRYILDWTDLNFGDFGEIKINCARTLFGLAKKSNTEEAVNHRNCRLFCSYRHLIGVSAAG
jgi:hypothetical protein